MKKDYYPILKQKYIYFSQILFTGLESVPTERLRRRNNGLYGAE